MEDGGSQQGFFHKPRLPQYNIKPSFYKQYHHQYKRQSQYQDQVTNATNFDGKRMRKTMTRRTVDYNASVVKLLENRVWQRDQRDMRPLQPDGLYTHEMVSPCEMVHNPTNVVSTKFVRTATNKIRCPIFCVVWTPEGRRLVTGASSGEFTLWNGMTFNFETILQAHDYPVRSMVWSHNNLWLMSGDHMGYVKYWQSNMNNVRMFQAHVDQAIREITFSPTDSKFATCSDDGSVRVFDFFRCHEERILRGHGADVKCLDWHPQKSIIVSGSKDSQQPVKLWDAKSGLSLATIHAHKSTVMSAKWNRNGNWLLTASRDHLVKVFDIRAMKEMSICRGHKKEATCVAWHPQFEDIFASGGSDGALLYWQVGHEKEVGGIEQAHDSIVWSLAWHPLGHMLCSGSNDHSTKFWTRNRPGDKMRDKYNLNTLPQGMYEDTEYDDDTNSLLPIIPGMGLEQSAKDVQEEDPVAVAVIPGLDSSAEELAQLRPTPQRKVPYAKPIPIEFQKKWEAMKAPGIAPKEVLEKEAQFDKQSEPDKDFTNPTHQGGQNAPQAASIPSSKSGHIPHGPPQAGPPKTGLLGAHPGSSVPSNDAPKTGLLGTTPLFEPPEHEAGVVGGDVDMRRFSDVDMRNVPMIGAGGPPPEARLDDSYRDGPPRDGMIHDGPHREESYRDGPHRDGSQRDGPHRDRQHREGPHRDGPHHDGSQMEGPLHDIPPRDSPHRGGPPPWDGPPRDGPPRDGSHGPSRDGPPRDGSHGPSRDGPPRVGSHGPPRDGPPRDGSHGPSRDGPPRDGSHGPSRDGPPRDGSHGPSRDGPPRDGSHGPPRDGPPRDGQPRDRDMRSDPQFHDEDLRFSGPRDFDAREFQSPLHDKDLRSNFNNPGQSGASDYRHDIPRDMDLRRDNFDNDDRRNFMQGGMQGGMNQDGDNLHHGRLQPRSGNQHGGQRSGVDRDEQEPMHDQRFPMDRGFPQDQDRGVKRGFDEERERGPGMGRGFSRGGHRGGNRGGRGGRGGGQWRNDNNRGRGGFRGGRGRAR